MVTQRTLADLLIEAGFEPEAALRASELLEQDLSDLARQSEVNLRFDRVDEQFAAQERVTNAQFDAVNKDIKAIHTRIDDLKDSVDRSLQDHKDSVDRSLQDHKDSIDRSLQDHKEGVDRSLQDHKEGVDRSLSDHRESIDRRSGILTWAIGIGFTLTAAGFGVVIALLVELLNR